MTCIGKTKHANYRGLLGTLRKRYGDGNWNTPTDLFCPCSFCFAPFVCLFVFLGNFFVVTAQLRREMTKGLLYLTTGTARRKKFTVSYWLGRGALSSATNWFPFFQITGRPRIIVKKWKECKVYFQQRLHRRGRVGSILGDPGADSGSEGKSKRAEK